MSRSSDLRFVIAALNSNSSTRRGRPRPSGRPGRTRAPRTSSAGMRTCVSRAALERAPILRSSLLPPTAFASRSLRALAPRPLAAFAPQASADPRPQAAFAPQASSGAQLLAAAPILRSSLPPPTAFASRSLRALAPRPPAAFAPQASADPSPERWSRASASASGPPSPPTSFRTAAAWVAARPRYYSIGKIRCVGGVSVPYLFSAALNVRGCVSNPRPIALQSPRHIRAAC